MKITFVEEKSIEQGSIVVGVFEDFQLTAEAIELDTLMSGSLKRALEINDFKGKRSEIFSIIAPRGLDLNYVHVIGLGKRNLFTQLELEELGGYIVAHLLKYKDKEVFIDIRSIKVPDLEGYEIAALIGSGLLLRSWQFNKYKLKEKKERKAKLKQVFITTQHIKQATNSFSQLGCVTEGIFKTREVVTEPANILYPESFAKSAQQLQEIGVKVEVFGEKEMKKLGMNALLGVGQGSEKESQLVIMQWQGLKKDTAPLAFVGKGVTFDSGGLSLKSRAGMAEMKSDMAGAGTVLGIIQALALRKAKVNVVGIIGLAENMPSGTAQRPGDIVTSLSGQTIEILDTDAEGRLVLADALWYAQGRFNPKVMVDLATLTGAIVIALGHEYAGFFSDNEELALQILESSKATGEKLWRLPLHESYDKTLDSDIADVKNLGSDGAGSITAAHFLKRFTNKVPWIHIDIAGTAWSKKDQPLCAKGATAFGVRLLNHFVVQHYEQ